MSEEEIKLIDGFFNKGWCCDLDEVYNTVMKTVKRNKQLEKENAELKVLEDDIKDKRIAYIDTPEFEENYIPKPVIRDMIEELEKYEKLAKEQIENRIVIADSDSLNYGRAEAHNKDIQVLKEILGDE